MSILYLDTSALVKMYLPENEAERQLVLEQIDRHGRVATCSIGYAEVCSALARYFHEGRSTEEDYTESLDTFAEDWLMVNQIGVIAEVSVVAGQLMKAHRGLRAMDALHLSAALWLRSRESIQFLSFDTHLQTVARSLMPDAFA